MRFFCVPVFYFVGPFFPLFPFSCYPRTAHESIKTVMPFSTNLSYNPKNGGMLWQDPNLLSRSGARCFSFSPPARKRPGWPGFRGQSFGHVKLTAERKEKERTELSVFTRLYLLTLHRGMSPSFPSSFPPFPMGRLVFSSFCVSVLSPIMLLPPVANFSCIDFEWQILWNLLSGSVLCTAVPGTGF